MSNKYALVTGASSGIGYELSKVFANNGYNLVLVARSQDKLEHLAEEIRAKGLEAQIIVKDLSAINAAEELFAEIKNLHIQLEAIANNAGFGEYGYYWDTEMQKEEKMMYLNMITLAQFTKLVMRDWVVNNNKGYILNTASVAAFIPGPKMAIYHATKAFVLSFSESITVEAAKKGIKVTALCPGATETGFFKRGSMQENNFDPSKEQNWTAADVAADGFEALMKGKPVVISAPLSNKLALNISRYLPKFLVRKIMGKIYRV